MRVLYYLVLTDFSQFSRHDWERAPAHCRPPPPGSFLLWRHSILQATLLNAVFFYVGWSADGYQKHERENSLQILANNDGKVYTPAFLSLTILVYLLLVSSSIKQ